MAEQKKKTIVKKRKVDKWKNKTWFTIFASKEFAGKEIGTTIAEKPESLVGRTVKVSVRSLAGQARKHHITLIFKIDDVKGNKAYAKSIGHEILGSYLRKFVRNRSSKIETTQILNLKSGEKIKIKTVALTVRKVEKKKKTAIRKVIEEKIQNTQKETNTQKLISDLVFGTIPQNILSLAKKVAPIKRVEITKSRVIASK